jgi:mono/diheme cytochrome c family protein
VLLGGVLLVTGLLFLFSSVPLGSIYTRTGLSIAGPGLAVAVIGVLIVGVNFSDPGEDVSKLQNPFPPTADSVALGEIAYGATCSSCHGIDGFGGGPLAGALASPPADLTVHVPLHLDGDLFSFMRDGISGTPMKSLSDVLSEDEMWHLVNFIRELARR